MMWEIAIEIGKREAKIYADRKSNNSNSIDWCFAFNGYFDGYMQSKGEIESLRKINERLQPSKDIEVNKKVLDDLI